MLTLNLAYYADHLCERGRDYLRKFFIGNRDLEMEIGVDRDTIRALTDSKQQARINARKGKGKEIKNGKFVKSLQERKQEKIDREEVDETVNRLTWNAANEKFCKYVDERGATRANPWEGNGEVGNMMFWM